MIVQKGGQVTKPIIVVKISCKVLYIIQPENALSPQSFWLLIIIAGSD